jgi:hypothetical protein
MEFEMEIELGLRLGLTHLIESYFSQKCPFLRSLNPLGGGDPENLGHTAPLCLIYHYCPPHLVVPLGPSGRLEIRVGVTVRVRVRMRV